MLCVDSAAVERRNETPALDGARDTPGGESAASGGFRKTEYLMLVPRPLSLLVHPITARLFNDDLLSQQNQKSVSVPPLRAPHAYPL